MTDIKSKEKPKWYQVRWKLSNALVSLARKLYPNNPETTAFTMQCLIDQVIHGKAILRISPEDTYRKTETEKGATLD